jgi:hypothetical protein
MKVYHIAPGSKSEIIQLTGLQPKAFKRGFYAGDREPAIYFFEDLATAEDGVVNWLADEWPPSETTAAVFEVEIPNDQLEPDPEIAGSYRSKLAVEPNRLRLVNTWDL